MKGFLNVSLVVLRVIAILLLVVGTLAAYDHKCVLAYLLASVSVTIMVCLIGIEFKREVRE